MKEKETWRRKNQVQLGNLSLEDVFRVGGVVDWWMKKLDDG